MEIRVLTHEYTQVYSLDKRFVDPRRPTTKPTPEDQEEGLLAYSPLISLVPTSVLSVSLKPTRMAICMCVCMFISKYVRHEEGLLAYLISLVPTSVLSVSLKLTRMAICMCICMYGMYVWYGMRMACCHTAPSLA
jgi:hypothetical protein